MRENVSTRLDSELYKRLKFKAIEENVTINTMLEMSIELYLEYIALKKSIKNHSKEEYSKAFEIMLSKGF